MKIIIKENQRGFLFEKGNFKGLLGSGKRSFSRLKKEEIRVLDVFGEVKLTENLLKVISNDEDFKKQTIYINVPDSHIAILFKDGKIKECLSVGEYYFWNVYDNYSFELINVSGYETETVSQFYFKFIPLKYYVKILIEQGNVGLLYLDGKFIKTLESGTHFFWNYISSVTCKSVNLQIQQMDIVGQEILTADKIPLRLNFICRYNITDALSLSKDLKGFETQVYSMVQLALRRYIGGFRLDEILEQKESIAAVVLGKLNEIEKDMFVKFHNADIKDIILPGDIRDIMNTVLVAEKSAQANVIARREEVASTRSLLNTAKLLDENETLRRLKEMEYIERIFDKVGDISLSSNKNILSQLKEIVAVK